MNPERLLQNFDRLIDTPDAVLRLRRFILDLAVRGKLVEQNPEDEPAAELLRRIEAEKKQSFSSSDKKTQPLDEAQIPFAIPDNWHWVTLSKVTKRIHYGYTASADHNKSAVRLLRITDIQGNRVDWNSVPGCDIADSTVTQYELAPRDILIARTGGTIGKTFLVEDVPVKAVFASYLIRVIPSDGVSEYFLKRYMESPLYWNQLYEESKGTGQPNVNGKALGNLSIPIPPLTEQHRIVAKVDELMKLCDELEETQAKREKRRDRLVAATLHGLNNGSPDSKAREHLPFKNSTRFYFNHLPHLTTRPEHIQQLRQTILNLAVRGKLVPQDPKDEPAVEMLARVHEWRAEAVRKKLIRDPRKPLKTIDLSESPYELPDGWAWARLGEIIYIQSGDGLTSENMKGGAIPVYGGNGINGYHDTFNIEEPTIVIGRVGYYCGSIHVTPAKAWVTDNAFITKYCSQEFFQNFLVLLLKGTNLKENENATAQPVISGSKIYPIVVGIPPLAEQHRIVENVDELMALCDEMEGRINTNTTTSRKFLEATLQETLNGQNELQQGVVLQACI